MFAKQYTKSVNSSDLRDDSRHHATDPLVASALADVHKTGLGPLLYRVKFTDGATHKLFESGSRNLAQLLRLWTEAVTEKGKSRLWMVLNTEWDVNAAHRLYRSVAEKSLAYWMDSRCPACHGATQDADRRTCDCCKGTGVAEIEGGRYEVDRIKDMVSELDGLVAAHGSRADYALRRIE